MLRTSRLIVIFIVLGCPVEPSAQVSESPRIWRGFDGTHCETTKAELDLVAQTAGRDKTIIIIARLGSGESSRTLNRRRLVGLREYLESVRALPPDKLITEWTPALRAELLSSYSEQKCREVAVLIKNGT